MTSSSRPPAADSAAHDLAHQPRPWGTGVLYVVVLVLCLAAAALGTLAGLPRAVSILAAGLAGSAATALWFHHRFVVPLAEMERASRTMEFGDLGTTLPEVGAPVLRRLAEVVNSLSADFQEVLLLFAHLLRSARRSTELLHLHVVGDTAAAIDHERAAEIISDIEQMQEMIHDFKYFRVRLEDDAIVDTGVAGTRSRRPAEDTASLPAGAEQDVESGSAGPRRGRGELQ